LPWAETGRDSVCDGFRCSNGGLKGWKTIMRKDRGC
jgi:hypothetical protein